MAAAGSSFLIVNDWRRGSAATAVLCLVAGSGRLEIVVVSAGLAAAALAWQRGARPGEAVWSIAAALLAAAAAWGAMFAAGPRGLAAACLFAAAYYLIDASLNLLRIAFRASAEAFQRAVDGAAIEGLVWLAAAPLAIVHDPAWRDPGAGLALVAGELLLGLGLWGVYSRLRRAETELQSVEGLPAQIVAALADVHSEARVRAATTLARAAARRLRMSATQTLRAEAAVALLAADRNLAELRWRGSGAADSLRAALRAAEEQFDGGGPHGLKGREIPLEGRLAAAVRCWITLRRGAGASLSTGECNDLLTAQGGLALDPVVAAAVARAVLALPATLLDVSTPSSEGGALFGGRPSAALSEDDAALLERAPELLAAYIEILSVVGGDLNFDHHLEESLRIVQEAVGCNQAALFLRENNELVLRHGLGLPRQDSNMSLPLDCELLADPAILPDVEHLTLGVGGARFRGLLRSARSAMSATLRAEGRQAGAIVLLSSRWSAFRPEHARFLQLCAARLGAVVASSSAIDRIYREAQSDPVTGLPNQRGAVRRLESEIARASRGKQFFTVLFLDIDRLKPVNDAYGHRAGDRLLMETARRLESSMRRYDFLARVGGDEFLAILPGLNPGDVARRVEHLRQAVARKPIFVHGGVSIGASVSVGAATYPLDGETALALVAVSDERMYADKRARREESAQAASA